MSKGKKIDDSALYPIQLQLSIADQVFKFRLHYDKEGEEFELTVDDINFDNLDF